jgi:hypothetical protein
MKIFIKTSIFFLIIISNYANWKFKKIWDARIVLTSLVANTKNKMRQDQKKAMSLNIPVSFLSVANHLEKRKASTGISNLYRQKNWPTNGGRFNTKPSGYAIAKVVSCCSDGARAHFWRPKNTSAESRAIRSCGF